ncbi:prolyl hydroxylase family protein [Sphingomonas immobilis]|uniref:2OG-Fe(II) oxygenase n=1 Tax=Sphingomonas immobilis TaxID=3063997 RepID=A0ABT9A142_9SPHN|nr:2OG-Fe(II) oxygenase [Sphingomonas sp. CA1-15]MDO7843535.1 2OG-Fe(II) oxygenase [Sphingomonas sp. CA1-15]
MFFTKKPAQASPLRALYGESVTLRLANNPAMKQAKSDMVQLYYYPDFLDAAQCGALVRMIDAKRRPSTVLSEANADYRTSESCDMDRWSEDVRPTDEAIAALLGLDPVHGETMQGQRYAPGQQFRAHNDYFREDQPYWPAMQASGGQRTWTAMIYLNEVEEGGATWFPLAGLRINPKRGLLLAWNNMNRDGSPNEKTMHEGVAVMRGTKYIVTKWFREGNWIKQ